MKSLKDPNAGHLGHDADDPTGGDAAFYDWIAGTKDRPADLELFMWLLDELKDETEPELVRSLLRQWQTGCERDEFDLRLTMLSRLLPPGHPFHALKAEFAKN